MCGCIWCVCLFTGMTQCVNTLVCSEICLYVGISVMLNFPKNYPVYSLCHDSVCQLSLEFKNMIIPLSQHRPGFPRFLLLSAEISVRLLLPPAMKWFWTSVLTLARRTLCLVSYLPSTDRWKFNKNLQPSVF